MNIALVSHTYSLAGAERMLLNLAILLNDASSGYRPIMFIPRGKGDAMYQQCRLHGIQTEMMDEYPIYTSTAKKPNRLHARKAVACVPVLAKQFQENDIELIVSNTATSLVSVLAGASAQIPVIGWIHGILDSYLLPGEYDPFLRLYYDRVFLAMCEVVLYCSDWTKAFFQAYRKDRQFTFFNWTPPPQTVEPIPENCHTFVCLNALNHFKGIYTLLDAAQQLKDAGFSFQVMLYGSTETEEALKIKGIIEKKRLADCVSIHGYLSDIASAYNHSLCLLQPSFMESFGMTIIEAMSYGRPVIAADSGGPGELVADGKSGFITTRNDAGQLYDRMRYMLEHPLRAAEMGAEGRRLYEQFFSPKSALAAFSVHAKQAVASYQQKDLQRELLYDGTLLLLGQMADGSVRPGGMKPHSYTSAPPISLKALNQPPSLWKRALRKITNRLPEARCTYQALCPEPEFSKVGIVFCAEAIGYEGAVTLQLWEDGELAGESELPLAVIHHGEWTYFDMEPLWDKENHTFTVKVIFRYQKDSPHMTVYNEASTSKKRLATIHFR